MKTPDPKSLTELNLSADAVQVMKDIFENKIAFNRMIGLKIDAISATEANGHILMSEDLYGHYEHKRIHGGVISAVLDAMGVRHWLLESPADIGVFEAAFNHGRQQQVPTAVIVGHTTDWD